jgi:hypothetical protein
MYAEERMFLRFTCASASGFIVWSETVWLASSPAS